jgi:UDP-GlcNAc:undecaprenyl-phosphate GlcNAc-1-phosphate transferase
VGDRVSFLIAFAIALGLTPLAARVGVAAGLVDRPGDDLKIHHEAVPVLGGAAVVAACFVALAVLGRSPAFSVVGATILAFATGTVDDVRPLPPLARIGLLAAAGGILVADGAELPMLHPLAGTAFVLLLLAVTNAVNLMDGQDGLAGGLAAIAAVGLAAMLAAAHAPASLGLGLGGALVGFLAFNLRGRVFLGNGGAYATGVVLAVLAGELAAARGWRGLFAATTCLAPFALEVVSTIARRVESGAQLTSGDRGHSYDVLSARVGVGRSTIVFWIAGALFACAAYGVSSVPAGPAALITVAAFAIGASLGLSLWPQRPLLKGLST